MVDGPRSYPPTSVEDFLRCPTYWWLTKVRGWQPRVESEWKPNKLLGAAVAAGLAVARREGVGQRPPSPEAIQGALASLHAGFEEQDQWTLPTLEKLVNRGLQMALEGPQQVGMTHVVAAEVPIYGRRPDVVWRAESGGLVVDDDKVVMSLDAHQESWRVAEYDHSWQLRDYAYHVGLNYVEPVELARVHLIVLGPRKHITLHSMAYSPEALGTWYAGAMEVWAMMHAVETLEVPPWQNALACTNRSLFFGQRCPMYDACHLFAGDESKMPTLFERFPREAH